MQSEGGKEMIMAIDPGPTKSAYVVWTGRKVFDKGIMDNDALIFALTEKYAWFEHWGLATSLVIEQVRHYGTGMPVGASVFDTVFWSGRFAQEWPGALWTMPRMKVKIHLCGSARARDSNIRQALIDRFGPIGTVKNPNLIYGEAIGNKDAKMKADLWQALALAVTWWDQNKRDN